MAAKKLLLRAADLLNADADATFDSCKGTTGGWSCGDCQKDSSGRCKARREHDERRSTATALKQAAQKGALK